MKNLHLMLITAFFAISWTTGLVIPGDCLSAPAVQTERGFMTDRLLEQDINKGAAPLEDRDRDRDRDKKPEQLRRQRLDHAYLNGDDLNR